MFLRMASETTAGSRYAWSVVGFLWFAFLLNYVDRQAVFSLYPSFQRDLGFSDTELGLIGSVFLWVYSLCSIPAGRLADRLPRRALVIACLFVWSLAMVGTAASHSVNGFLFFRGLMGLSEAVYLPASVAIIAALHQNSTRSSALATHQTAQMMGIVLGGWSVAWLADRVGWRPSFEALAVVGVAYAPLLWFAMRKLPAGRAQAPRTVQWTSIFLSRTYLALAVTFTAYCVTLWILYAWFPIHLYDRFHLSQSQSGLAATLYLQISTMIGVIVWGFVADRLARRTRAARFLVLGAGVFFASPFAYLCFSMESLDWVKAASIGFGFFAGALHSNIAAACLDVAPENYGAAVGTLNLVGGMGGGLAVLLTGFYRESIGAASLVGYCGVVAMLASCSMLFLLRIYLPREFRAGAPTGRF